MDTNTQNLIQEKMDSLPPEFKKALATIDWAKIVQEIGQKNNIHIDKIGDLQTETMLLLMGVTHPGDYQTEVEKALGLPEDAGVPIVNDINEKILLPLRKKVMEATGEKEEIIEPAPAPEETGEDKDTIETLKRLDKMPDEVNKLISDPTLPVKISSIGKTANMNEKELSDLEDIISMVLLGYIHPDRLGVEVKSKFNYPDTKVTLIADSVNKDIFAPIKGALIKNYDDLLKEASSQGEVLKSAGVEVLGNPETAKPAAASSINIAAQKLSATFRMPKQESDLSLSKTVTTPSLPAVSAPPASPPASAPKIDPYKEKI
jgi:hypothetical protein